MRFSAATRHFGAMMTIAATLLVPAACGGLIFEQEGDCSVSYRLSFRYDWNIKFADAFPAEVRSVSVYAFDPEGVLVWQKSEEGATLQAEDYSMDLDLPSGSYDLIAWCGLDNGESFTVPQMRVGSSRMEELTCTLNRKRGTDGRAFSDTDLHNLYHGSLSVDIKDESDPSVLPGVYQFEMPLVKNTNHVRIILQHLSGEDVDVKDFTFSIEDDNGSMDHRNSLVDDEMVTYRNWSAFSGTAGVDVRSETVYDGTITKVSVAVADLTVGRMMADHPMVLTIRDTKEGKTVVRIPLTDYALLVKENYGRTMDSQEYLDRQDDYALTFFLDESRNWLDTFIYVNSWRIVLNPTELK